MLSAYIQVLGEQATIMDTGRDEGAIKLAIVSCLVNARTLQPFIFRNYEHPAGHDSYYRGSTKHKLWQAIQASAAAPGYFEEASERRLSDKGFYCQTKKYAPAYLITFKKEMSELSLLIVAFADNLRAHCARFGLVVRDRIAEAFIRAETNCATRTALIALARIEAELFTRRAIAIFDAQFELDKRSIVVGMKNARECADATFHLFALKCARTN